MLPILLALAFIAILIFVVIAGRPDEFCVTRTATISASPEKVFPHVNDLRAWEAWSPWAKLDPNVKSVYEGPASGAGASMAWSGNKTIGEGRMPITESRANVWIQFKLEFLRPFKATNTAEFVFTPRANQTVIGWTMLGKNNFGSKVFSLLMNCDKMVGNDFDRGLANLASVVEKNKATA